MFRKGADHALQPHGADVSGRDADAEFREEVDAFYGSVFGWSAFDTDVVGQSCHLLLPDPDQFVLLAESDKPMTSPGYDHLGLLQDSRDEVDSLLVACERYAEKDDRVKIRRYEDLVYPGVTVHAFYVKYLLRSTSTCRAWSTTSQRKRGAPWTRVAPSRTRPWRSVPRS